MSKKRNFNTNPTRLVVKEEKIMEDDNLEQTTDYSADQEPNRIEESDVTEGTQESSESIVVEHIKEEAPKVEPVVTKQSNQGSHKNTKHVDAIVTTSDVDTVIEASRNGTNQFNKTVASFLDKYAADMAPGVPVNAKNGGHHQYNLYSTINQILNKSNYEAFKDAFTLLVAYIVKHKDDVFSEKYAFRFAEEWPSSVDRLSNFHALLNLLMIMSKHNERPISKYVSLERTFNTGFSEVAKENLMRFIGK